MDTQDTTPDKTDDLPKHHKTFIKSQNHCALCGSQLSITVESYLENYNLKEEAHCPTCKIKTRIKDHKLQ